jgi:hypothetical protein
MFLGSIYEKCYLKWSNRVIYTNFADRVGSAHHRLAQLIRWVKISEAQKVAGLALWTIRNWAITCQSANVFFTRDNFMCHRKGSVFFLKQ